MGKLVFEDETSWNRAKQDGIGRLLLPGLRRVSDPSAFYEAAHFVGGALLSHGFRLFRNGGLPLLERRQGALVEEIIIEAGAFPIKGAYAPLSVKVHISHEGMRTVRERYWRVPSRAPMVIASGHLGLVDVPPNWILWNVAGGGGVLEELALWVADLAPKWFSRFESPEALSEQVLRREVPLLRTADALEYVLLERGREPARKFLRDLIEFGGTVSPQAESLRRVDEFAPLKSRLDAIATCYRLR